MTAQLDKIAFLSCSDLSAAEVSLRQIPNDDPNASFVPTVLERLKNGQEKLFSIENDGTRIGYTVYHIENFGEHKEFVSVATKTNSFKPLRFSIEEMLCKLAIEQGCKSIRFHTVRAGLVKEALSIGWHVSEVVLRKNLT